MLPIPGKTRMLSIKPRTAMLNVVLVVLSFTTQIYQRVSYLNVFLKNSKNLKNLIYNRFFHYFMDINTEIEKKIEDIANKARNSIGTFCSEECQAYCCRKGYLVMKPDQVNVVTHGNNKVLETEGLLKELPTGNFSLHMSKREQGCTSLDNNNKCNIYNNTKRPKTCHDFPIFIRKKQIFFSPRCLAVKQRKFYIYEKEFLNLGYTIVAENPFIVAEIYD